MRRRLEWDSSVAFMHASRSSAASRRWQVAWPARSEHALVLLSREEDDRVVAVVGWASQLGRQVGFGQVFSLSLSLSLFLILFLFFYSFLCFDLVIKYQTICKMLKIFVGTFEIISNSPQLVSPLLEHLNYL